MVSPEFSSSVSQVVCAHASAWPGSSCAGRISGSLTVQSRRSFGDALATTRAMEASGQRGSVHHTALQPLEDQLLSRVAATSLTPCPPVGLRTDCPGMTARGFVLGCSVRASIPRRNFEHGPLQPHVRKTVVLESSEYLRVR